MKESETLTILNSIQQGIIRIEESIARIPRKKPIQRQKGCTFSQRLRGGLRDPEVRAAIMRLKKEGQRYDDIASYIRDNWPGQPEKHPSRSAIQRFFHSAIDGRLREFGIEPPIEL